MGLFKNLKTGSWSAKPSPNAKVPLRGTVEYRAGDTVQLGANEVKLARIECCYRSSESQWGFHHQGATARRAAALYFDLSFDQPSGCLIDNAEIHLKFSPVAPLTHQVMATSTIPGAYNFTPTSIGMGSAPTTTGIVPSSTVSATSSSVQVTEWFGPRYMKRELGHRTGTKNISKQPELSVNVAGQSATIGGLGTIESRDIDVPRRWELWGIKDTGDTGIYDTLIWRWQGNHTETDLIPRVPFKSGLILYHEDTPFVVSLEIKGKLQGPTGGFVHSKPKRFPREISPEQSTLDLETIARTIDELMLKANEMNQT